MSSCTHNDHGHISIWWVIMILALFGPCVPTPSETRQNSRIDDLEHKVRELEARP